MLSLIVAMSENRVIGRDGGLPWRLRSDLVRFKKITMGHTLIMGRKTFESIGKVLPGRRTIVISRTWENTGTAQTGFDVAASLEEALALAHSDSEPFVVGGGEIYRQALPFADRLYLTLVDAQVAGETHFPAIDFTRFQLREREVVPASQVDEFAHRFEIWERTGWNDHPAC
jgi:dihydrofolate reductase